jgi:hypothetical protein
MTQLKPVVAAAKPATVEAWKWDGTKEQGRLIVDWMEASGTPAYLHPYENLIVPDIQYSTAIKPGEWVVRDKFCDFFPLPDDIYRATYASPLP